MRACCLCLVLVWLSEVHAYEVGTHAEVLTPAAVAAFEDDSFPTIRPLRHFYNPVTGEGLNIPLIPTQSSSPDWALALPGAVRGQRFSYWDARQSLLDALTKRTETERKAAFGRTFQTLGQVAHHLQDMAQPQHDGVWRIDSM